MLTNRLTDALMPGLVPGIHVLREAATPKAWMAGTSPAMTENAETLCTFENVGSLDGPDSQLSSINPVSTAFSRLLKIAIAVRMLFA
jgi:hypothetical protein